MTDPRPTLSGGQNRRLRAMAHELEPVVHTGKKGVTEELAVQLQQALLDHELIKVKIGKNHPGELGDNAEAIAAAAGAALVQKIGRVAILYRPHPLEPQIDPGNP